MPLPPDILAGSLSASQREALVAFCSRVNNPWGYFATDLGVSGAACSALVRRGCLMGGMFPGDRSKAYRWTELGAEVFEILQAQAGEAGTAETSTKIEGSVHEHAVPKGCAQPNPESPQ